MKKTVFFAAIVILMLFSFFNVNAAQIYYNDEYHEYEADEINLVVDGKSIDNLPMRPVIIDDHTMVPVREVFEALGSEIIWHDDTCQVEIVDNGVSLFIKIGDRNTYINGEKVPISAEQPLPMLIGMNPDGLKSMVPVRFVAEKLGFTVKWDNATRTVSIFEDEDSSSEIIGEITGDDDELVPEAEGVFGSVSAKTDDKYDYIFIPTVKGISPKITRFTNPERIAFDFPNAQFSTLGGTVQIDGICVKKARYSNHEDMARLVLDITDDAQPMILSNEKGIVIRVENSKNTNIIYDAFSGLVYFDKQYTGTGKYVNNGYSVTFTKLKLEPQKIEIHDGYIYEIIISDSSNGCTVKVDGSNKLTYTAEKGFFKKESANLPSFNDGERVIVIDAGHGGSDPGAIGYDNSGKAVAYESRINLAIALLVGEKLERSGIKIVYTRDSDEYISLKDRSELANSIGCDLFVSIHCNSIEKPSIDGTQVYYHPASEVGTNLAENIYDKIVEMTGLSPKETQNGSHLYVIRTTSVPAVLVETAFISNQSDRNYLLSKSGQETLAEAIYQGIMETLED